MEQDILKKLEEQEQKINLIYISVEKTRKYFQWTLIITVVTVLLPLIAMVIAVPWMISSLSSTYSGLGL